MTAAPPAGRWRDGIAAALEVTLAAPASWATGLAGFLAGGGIVLVSWPVLVLPTPTGLQNDLGGPVSSLAFGSPSPTLLLVIAGLVAAGAATFLLGLGVGAWAERAGIVMALDAAPDAGLVRAPEDAAAADRAPGMVRVMLVRVLSLVPVVVVAVLAWPSIYAATYRELLVPGDLAVPVALRVVLAIPGVVAGLIGAWFLADTAAALAVRRLVIGRRGVPASLALGWADLVRRPHRALATAVVGLGLQALPAVLALVGAAIGWSAARTALVSGGDALEVALPVLLWIATWLAALVLAGAGAAFRSAAFTFEVRNRLGPAGV